jgi:vacuolar-type H+-ATPase subunit H
MSLEAVKQVTAAEEQARLSKLAAQQDARKLIADAEKAGRSALEQAKAEANETVASMLAQAEQRAGVRTSEIIHQAEGSCDQLRAQAQARLEQAASLIVERVVNA